MSISKTKFNSQAELVRKPQNLKSYKGSWNETDHVLFKGAQVGDVMDILIPASSPVAEKLTLFGTKSNDFGILHFSVNGKSAGAEVDFYAAKPVSSGAIELGAFDPVDSAYMLRVEVVGKNPASKGTFFGLDCVSLKTLN